LTTNAELQTKYDAVYRGGAEKFFTTNSIHEELGLLRMVDDWTGLRVLEIGCGEGRLASMIGMAGADRVDAIDYSESAVKIARERINLPNVRIWRSPWQDVEGRYDVVVMQGVLEHLDAPWDSLKAILERLVVSGGLCLTSSPNFINPRGYIWMALQTLLDVPMSLSDLHFLMPWDFHTHLNEYAFTRQTIHHDWAAGGLFVQDFRKRLKNALRDAGLDNTKVDKFCAWLERAVAHDPSVHTEGAVQIYRIEKP
jgi:2-polyprenyl-3-methyl-5-hydroxy-6-metoxy-1,4-benzoquinol methylase